jgi:hypothetical protein
MTDQFSRDIDRFQKDIEARLKRVSGEHKVPFRELFPPSFMRQHSELPNIEALFMAGGYSLGSDEDFAKIPDEDWERLITSHTSFASWKEMMETAGAEYAGRKFSE